MDRQAFIRDLRALETAGKDATELYNEISRLATRRVCLSERPERCAHYLSIEFLIGRVFYNNLMELGVLGEAIEILREKGVDAAVFEEIGDAALGNGGLGRLAACYLDSAAAVGVPLYGYGIRYRYGLFRQRFEKGFQREFPDDWQRFGDPWSVRREAERQIIRFADMQAVAVPYDMPVIGKRVNALRLYQAEGGGEAEKISGVLYPPDDTGEGKLLRIRQEYFMSAAAVGDILRAYEERHANDYGRFAAENSVQLNDTHPVFAIPELIRQLSLRGVACGTALKIVKATFNYTNHTILPEALERWDAGLLREVLPDIADILDDMAVSQRRQHKREGYTKEETDKTAVRLCGSRAYSMANTAVYVANKVNGVAEIHSEILKRRLFPEEYAHHPEKFLNVTNGVTQRRWLELANPELSAMLDRRIGSGWRRDFGEIAGLITHAFNTDTLKDFIGVKQVKKRQLFRYVQENEGVRLGEGRILFAQVKRLHEYKRQLMTAFALLRLYFELKQGKLESFVPSVFLFGAKSAPTYSRAKGIIKYLNEIIAAVNADPETNNRLQGVFVTEYNVSYAEKIVAAADVSLQVSTAGLEASGTGNMKFMMNGAVTLGTLDGANIEIVQRAGEENNYIFGARVDEIERLKEGEYDPAGYLNGHPEWKRVAETLTNGSLSDDGTGCFQELFDSLTVGAAWHKPDHYFIFRDVEEYYNAILRANRDYAESLPFARKQLLNTANSAYFSSDRSVREYASKIWGLL